MAGITSLYDAPFFEGQAASATDIVGKFMIGLAGRGYMVDLKSGNYRRQSIQLLRQQSDQSLQPNEASINPEDLWRRTTSTWHKGAGQRNYDAPTDSDPARFYISKGVDPWTRGELSLLPATTLGRTSANTNLNLTVAGAYVYLTDGTDIVYSTNLTSWTNITGEPGTAATAITSDGFNVWSAHGSDGIYATTAAAVATASYVTGTVNGVKYVKGRLFAWSTYKLYNIVAGGALPTELYSHPNTDFRWVDVAEGPGFYYAAGYSGDKSLIYQTAVKADGTALVTPVVAGQLPDGEIVQSIQGYLGFILIGSSLGVRFAQPLGSGGLIIGELIDDMSNVRCFEGQDRFVWFGWTNYDTVSTGLGRVDLSTFNDTAPAYASDLMATAQGTVESVITLGDLRAFTVSGAGVYYQSANKVTTGSIETGRIGYGIFDPKVSMFVTVSTTPLAGGLQVYLAKDGGDFVEIGSISNIPSSVRSDFPTNRARGEVFELRFVLTRDAVTTTGPTIGRFTLRAYPASPRSERISVPLIIADNQQLQGGARFRRHPSDDLAFLSALEVDGSSVSYQEGSLVFAVVLEDHLWEPHHLTEDNTAFNGTYTVILKRFAEE